MNPDQPSRERIEARITALLLNELPAGEADLLRYTLAQDPALQKLHDQLQATLPLVREAAKGADNAPVAKAGPLKLSAGRREELLAHFKTGRPAAVRDPLSWLKRINRRQILKVAVVLTIVLAAWPLLHSFLPAGRSRGSTLGIHGSAPLDEAVSLAQSIKKPAKSPPAQSVSAARPMAQLPPELKLRTWSADQPSLPAGSSSATDKYLVLNNAGEPPAKVLLAPEPALAPPPVPPSSQIYLPSTQRDFTFSAGPPGPAISPHSYAGLITPETGAAAPRAEYQLQTPTMDAQQLQITVAREQDQGDAIKQAPYSDAQRDLDQKIKMQRLLQAKIEAERLDLDLPQSSLVQIIDPAKPVTTQTLWQHLKGEYASNARLKVESDVADISGINAFPDSHVQGYDPYFIQTTFEAIQSDAVLGKAVDALDLRSAWAKDNGGQKLTKSEAVAQLRHRLDLSAVPNTKLIQIAATGSDPQQAADIANGVAKAYQTYRLESTKALLTNGIALLEGQYRQQNREIEAVQAKRHDLEKSINSAGATESFAENDRPLRKPSPAAPVPQPEVLTSSNAVSTFALNVSDVSFKFAQATLQQGKMPDTAAIRSEEFINAFDYRDPQAAPGQPMAFTSERARYPFAHNRDLLRFSIKAAAAGRQAGRALNLVLLLDTSGSMERADRVQIIREALRVLATQLHPNDTVSVVTFARTARLWADGVSGDKAGATLDKVGGITPEGGTNLEEAMRLAYATARRHYLPDGLNRVVLLTDGAANLGNVDPDALRQTVDAQRRQGIALDCFGIGWEDYNDDLLEELSSHGDGRYAFLNSPEDAAKDFGTKLAGALQVAATDLKVQVEFNPQRVIAYRQIGYARHQLTREQFRDNTVAAGEIAAQEAGNALYAIQINPAGEGPVATVRVRYRVPGTHDYRERNWNVAYTGTAPPCEDASPAMRLATAAGAFSEWLAGSPYAQEVSLDALLHCLNGVPEMYGADQRPKQLETMIRSAKSLEGK